MPLGERSPRRQVAIGGSDPDVGCWNGRHVPVGFGQGPFAGPPRCVHSASALGKVHYDARSDAVDNAVLQLRVPGNRCAACWLHVDDGGQGWLAGLRHAGGPARFLADQLGRSSARTRRTSASSGSRPLTKKLNGPTYSASPGSASTNVSSATSSSSTTARAATTAGSTWSKCSEPRTSRPIARVELPASQRPAPVRQPSSRPRRRAPGVEPRGLSPCSGCHRGSTFAWGGQGGGPPLQRRPLMLGQCQRFRCGTRDIHEAHTTGRDLATQDAGRWRLPDGDVHTVSPSRRDL